MFLQWTSLLLLVAITSDIVLSAPTLPATNGTASECHLLRQYLNNKYPLTDPIKMPDGSVKFRIAMISDLDGSSVSTKESNTWYSYFKQGHLTYNAKDKAVTVEWDSAPDNGDQIKSDMSKNGRGLELSELVTYNGQLITLDDKTGLVYVFENKVLIPWVIVTEGDGHQKGAMKNEWATVKDSKLYVGSHGRELPDRDGHLTHNSYMTMWVKTIDQQGGVKHLNWTENYMKVRAAAGIHYPGYMTHESCVWSDVHGRWFFLPRKASMEKWNYKDDEKKGTNMLLMASPDFNNVMVKHIGEIIPNRGYASFKFIPGTNDTVIVAIHTTEEDDGRVTAAYISVFTIDGEIIYPQTKVSDLKFEGFEFI